MARGDETVAHGHGVVGVDPPAALDRQPLPGELIHQVEQLQERPIGGVIELEVQPSGVA